jgi:hypothetical protein
MQYDQPSGHSYSDADLKLNLNYIPIRKQGFYKNEYMVYAKLCDAKGPMSKRPDRSGS